MGAPAGLIRSMKTLYGFFMMTDEANISADIRELARVHGRAAIAVLAEIMNQADAPASARLSAARTLLDRGWGKVPTQRPEAAIRAPAAPRTESAMRAPRRPQKSTDKKSGDKKSAGL